MVKEEEKKDSSIWQVQEIATQTEKIIINSKTQEQLDIYSTLTKILNKLEELDKKL